MQDAAPARERDTADLQAGAEVDGPSVTRNNDSTSQLANDNEDNEDAVAAEPDPEQQ